MKIDENKRNIGQNLQDLREERGLSQEKLEELSGVDRSYISNIETGTPNKNPTIKYYLKIAEALGATFSVTSDEKNEPDE